MRGWSLATAESLTGGLVGGAITAVPGASDSFRGGVISYAVAVKTAVLGVPEAVIADRGVVSEQVAVTMAQGVRRVTGADVGLATTGVAGPGPDGDVPAGTAWIAVVTPETEAASLVQSRHGATGDREGVRRDVVEALLALAVREVTGSGDPARIPGATSQTHAQEQSGTG